MVVPSVGLRESKAADANLHAWAHERLLTAVHFTRMAALDRHVLLAGIQLEATISFAPRQILTHSFGPFIPV